MTYENAVEAAEFIKSKYDRPLKTALVLGSGLGDFADSLDDAVKLSYQEIPHFARSTVKGHAGRLVLGEIEGVPVAVQQGRFHYYEGYAMEQVIFPVRVFGVLGIETITEMKGSFALTRITCGRAARAPIIIHQPNRPIPSKYKISIFSAEAKR